MSAEREGSNINWTRIICLLAGLILFFVVYYSPPWPDAVDPMGLVLCSENVRLGIVTDLGRTTPLVNDRRRGCNGLIAEFNHDEKMLEEGPYPLDLKRRIKGPDGHRDPTGLLADDGDHPNAAGHALIARLVLAQLTTPSG